ncbi:MAG TPA: hypothetical protein VG848_03590 [Acetobacteraceae bacterium]|jgi:hypothetical protein|nr:hypothetical protein [Acetobacteraceae bacterium]
MRITKMRLIAMGVLALLAGCGEQQPGRTTGGAAAGAATGAGIGALAGPPGILAGAVIGGGAGALTGSATKPSQVNLGTPPWNNPNTRVPTPNGPVGPNSQSAPDSTGTTGGGTANTGGTTQSEAQ